MAFTRASARPPSGSSQNRRARVTIGITTQVSSATDRMLPISRLSHSSAFFQSSLIARVSRTTVG